MGHPVTDIMPDAMRRLKLSAGLLIFMALSPAIAAADPAEPDDLMKVVQINEVAPAPGGNAIAVRGTQPELATDTEVPFLQVVLQKADGDREVRELINGSELHWSPDGQTLYFISPHGEGGSILRAYERETDTVRDVIGLPYSVQHVAYDPDSQRIAFVAAVPARPGFSPALPAEPEKARTPVFVDHALFRTPDGTFLPPLQFGVFVADPSAGDVRQLALPSNASLQRTEAGDGGGLTWLGGGVVVSASRGFDKEANLWNVNRDLLYLGIDGEKTWLTDDPRVESHPKRSPDGEQLAYLRSRSEREATVSYDEVIVMDVDTETLTRPVSEHDVHVETYVWAGSDNDIIIKYPHRARRVLARISSNGDIFETLSDDAHSGMIQAADGVVGFTLSADGAPPEAATVDANGALTVWTDNNAHVAALTRPVLEEIEYPSAHRDNRPIHALVAYPADESARNESPVVIDLHGGPYHASYRGYDPRREFFVSRGYTVIQPNYRGSYGYGEDFAQLSDRRHYPGRADDPSDPSEMGLDVVGALQAIRDTELGDPDRVFLRGLSAGALLTVWTLGRTDDIRAAVAQSWYPGEWGAPFYGWYQMRLYFKSAPWLSPARELAYQREPWSMIDQIKKTPLLFIHGESDYYTPLHDVEKIYYALRSAGADTALAIFPGEVHGIRRYPASLRNSLIVEDEWFAEHDEQR